LRCCIRYLEHNLRDITAHCSAKRESCKSLEALIGGKSCTLFWLPYLSLDLYI
jgi:hypothetical protein